MDPHLPRQPPDSGSPVTHPTVESGEDSSTIDQCFSNFNVNRNYLWVLLKSPDLTTECRFYFNRFEVHLRVCISKKFPDEAGAVDPGATRPEFGQ